MAQQIFDLNAANVAQGINTEVAFVHRFNSCATAIVKRQGLCIHYTDVGGGSSARVIFPVTFIMSTCGAISVRAWCTMRGEWRTFLVKGMHNAYVVEGMVRPQELNDGLTDQPAA